MSSKSLLRTLHHCELQCVTRLSRHAVTSNQCNKFKQYCNVANNCVTKQYIHTKSTTKAVSSISYKSALSQLSHQLQYVVCAVTGTIIVLYTIQNISNSYVHAESTLSNNKSSDTLSVYTVDDVKQHGRSAERVWVTYNNNVYDITDFIQSHPGGANKIILAAGTDVAPFWNIYQQHRKTEVQKILQQYLIGRLDPSTVKQTNESLQNGSDPYANEPERHPALVTISDKPYNSETPPPILQSRITPNELFFTRNHMFTPRVNADTYKLTVTGDDIETIELDMNDIKTKFVPHSVEVTTQCAGNRRHEMIEIKPIKGLDWQCGSISNAVWTGAKLRDILQYAGLNVNGIVNNNANTKVKHVQLEGLDVDPITQTGYGASITVDKAVSPTDDVIVAYQMNGSDIPPDHGYPIRVVVPGVVGARSVKWCNKIITSNTESQSHWQQKDYKGFNASVDWTNVDWNSAPAIQETPITSAILSPTTTDKLSKYDDEINVVGYAYTGGGRDVIRVDVSADNGVTWHNAHLNKTEDDKQKKKVWNWIQWNTTIPIQLNDKRNVQLICKATDSQYNTQPDTVAPIWNLRGVLNNAWHRVNLVVDDDSDTVDVQAASSPELARQKE